ncbi:MAG: hypothetical protein Q9211_004355 [Gyalolechia sp. 1 TL-2023]
MSFIQILVGALLAFLVSGLPANVSSSNGSTIASTPGLVRIFTASIHLADFSPPIPIPGGQRIVAKVNNGKLSGESLNGTVQGGVSVIDIVNGGQAIEINVRSYGSTSDGVPFLVEESGVGSSADGFARLVCVNVGWVRNSGTNEAVQLLSIGGQYANLANEFLLTETTLSSDRKTVSSAIYRAVDR